MFEFQYFVAVVATIMVTSYFLFGRKKNEAATKNFPPGPPGYPLVGNLFQMDKNRHKTMIEWSKQYGDIIGLRFGPIKVVVLNNYKHIREAFGENVFSGRPISKASKDRNRGGMRGVIINEGQGWQEQRRFCLRNLKDFGFGKKSMESLIMDEVSELISSFAKTAGQPLSTQNKFNAAVLNALWSITCGRRYSHDDPELTDLLTRLNQVITQTSIFAILAQFFPIVYKLRKSFPKFFRNPGQEFQKKSYAFLDNIVKEHKESFQSGSPRDFIDAYLEQVERTEDTTSSFYKKEGEEGLPVLLLDLFIAGAETTSTTLVWAFLIYALHPEAQEKLHREIGKVVENSRSVSLTDRPNLPYLDAAINEVMRFSSLVPLGVNHRAMEDVTFHDFEIPKDTMIMGNLYSASRDKAAWGDPENFRPERFLSDDGTTLLRNDAFIPFSIGKRVCLGEVLARDELWLFMGNLFQRFKVGPVPGQEKPVLDSNAMAVLIPKPHQLVLTDRFTN